MPFNVRAVMLKWNVILYNEFVCVDYLFIFFFYRCMKKRGGWEWKWIHVFISLFLQLFPSIHFLSSAVGAWSLSQGTRRRTPWHTHSHTKCQSAYDACLQTRKESGVPRAQGVGRTRRLCGRVRTSSNPQPWRCKTNVLTTKSPPYMLNDWDGVPF